MKGFRFNYRDLFRAPRVAFSMQRIWVSGIGLLAGYLIYLVVTYLAMAVGGVSLSSVWFRHGLLPCAFAEALPWYAMLIYWIGVLLFLAVILLTNTAVSRVVYMVLRDELFYTWTQAYRFALKKWISVLGAMLTFLFMIAFFVIGALIMGYLGRIPYIGEIGTTLLTLPYIFAALLLLFISVVFVVGLFFVPAIIATSDEDALGGVFQSFSITFNQPWRLIVYSLIIGVLKSVGVFLFAAALKISYRIFIALFTVGMGEKLVQIKEYALALVDRAFPSMYGFFQALPMGLGNYVYLTHSHALQNLPGTYVISGYIFAFFLILLAGTVVAYGAAIGNAGLTIIYVILYKLHEDENLLEREDEELKEEEEEEEESKEEEEEQEEELEEDESSREEDESGEESSKTDSDQENEEEEK